LKKRHAFRPDVSAAALEDRLVLNSSPAILGAIAQELGVSQALVSSSRNEPIRLAIRDLYLARFQRDFTNFDIQFGAASSQITSNPSAATSAVSQALTTLTTNVTSALALSPRAARSLIPAVEQLLMGAGPNSLASQLTALTPTSTSAQASGIISNAQLQLYNALNVFTRSPNFDFSGFFSGTTAPVTTGTGTTAPVTTGTGTGTGTGTTAPVTTGTGANPTR
jgi:hypothetical protein